jgi:hypothetical protein
MTAWGAKGKYWNVGLSDPDRLAATPKQIAYIYKLSNRQLNLKGKGLTRGDASKLIEDLKAQRDADGPVARGPALMHAMFDAALHKAIDAASKAAQQWVDEHRTAKFHLFDQTSRTKLPIYDQVGEAYLRAPKRSQFEKWLRSQGKEGEHGSIRLPHVYAGRPELGLQVAAAQAAKASLEANNVLAIAMDVRSHWS